MTEVENLAALSISKFISFLKENNIKRFYFAYDESSGKVKASHAKLESIADLITIDKRDFDKHEGLFFELYEKYDVILGAFVHRTNRGQAAGGVRFWEYETVAEYIHDGMRLAKGMTHKNALAGLWWGGGKGVIANNLQIDKMDPEVRKDIYCQFGKFITSLNGCYVTAEDVGTHVSDMANVFAYTRFTTCIPESLGGSGNPSIPTARGVVAGIETALDFLNMGNVEGRIISVQGLGNVAVPLIQFLFDKKIGKVIAADINSANVEKAKILFEGYNFEARTVEKGDDSILFEDCDIVAPCATGAVFNPATIPNIKAKIICGAANNQLEDQFRDDIALMEKGILYVPDFLTNRMGIVNCANEQYGYIENDPNIFQHFDRNWEHSIYQIGTTVFSTAKNNHEPTGKIALELAEKLSLVNHPVLGHRSQLIINSIVNSGWEKGNC